MFGLRLRIFHSLLRLAAGFFRGLIRNALRADEGFAHGILKVLEIILFIIIRRAGLGVGSGLALRFGGAMDGVEVMAVIFAKRLNITVGTFVMLYNLLLYIICGLVLQSWILPLYSIVTYGAALKTVDFIVEGLDRSKAAMIITSRPDEVCAALMETFETGLTKIDASGGYSNAPKTVVYFVVNRFQIARMKSVVHEQDPTAYITITEVADVFRNNQD